MAAEGVDATYGVDALTVGAGADREGHDPVDGGDGVCVLFLVFGYALRLDKGVLDAGDGQWAHWRGGVLGRGYGRGEVLRRKIVVEVQRVIVAGRRRDVIGSSPVDGGEPGRRGIERLEERGVAADNGVYGGRETELFKCFL